MKKTLLAALILALCPMLPSGAQESPVPGERVDVELVVVDLVAETKDGLPVPDLTPDELRVFEDGQPVEIVQMSAGGASGRPGLRTASSAGSSDPAAGRKIVIFVDDLHLHANSRRRVFAELGDVLDEHLREGDQVMVARYGGTTEVLLPLTDDRPALRRVLREQSESGTLRLMADTDDQRALEEIQSVRSQYSRASSRSDQACRDVGHVARAHAERTYNRILGAIDELERFVGSMAGFAGPKVLLHVSDGIPMVAGAEAYAFAAELCDGSGARKGLKDAIDTTSSTGLRLEYWDPTQAWTEAQQYDTSEAWRRLADRANAYRVAFYTFQATPPSNRSGSVDSVRTSFDVERAGERNRQDALHLIADETGGAAILGAGDIETALGRMEGDRRAAYELAYEPPSPGDGGHHEIRVESTRAGVRLRHRRSYRSIPFDERVGDRVLSTLLYGGQVNPLQARVQVAERGPGPDGVDQVRLRVEVPLERLVFLPDEERRRGVFAVYVVVRNGTGAISPVGSKTLPVHLPAGDELDQVYTYVVELPVSGDGGDVAVAVQDRVGGEVSFLKRAL